MSHKDIAPKARPDKLQNTLGIVRAHCSYPLFNPPFLSKEPVHNVKGILEGVG